MCCIINHLQKTNIPVSLCRRPGPVSYQRVCHSWADAVHCEGLSLYPVKGFCHSWAEAVHCEGLTCTLSVKGAVTHEQSTGAVHCDLANTYS